MAFTVTANDKTISITADNDGPFGTDQNYTNGLQIDYSNSISDLNSIFIRYSPFSLLEHFENNLHKWHISVGQKMWTPSDIQKEHPEPNERPYAGFLYSQGELITISDTSTHTLGLLVGVTGSNSFAEEAQKFVHSLVGSDTPEGWDYQIEDTFIANLSYDGNYLQHTIENKSGLSHEFSTPLRVLAGNYRSELATGIMWRWGLNLQDSLGSAKTENEMSFKPHMVQGKVTGAFLFAGAEARYRFNDITIDGDRPDDVYPTDVEHIQATAVFGGAKYGESMGGSITLAFKSKDFEQDLNRHSANISMSLFWMYK
ncbi:lipid A deacylase LpxR family protein [Vibrio algarum]|uniref:Lipid A deacylase LpxR family protein n=1 Tax=Vibrio algarum TaxID=3020714 RepID=A0ABT4YPU7_9VIBR|nr:lipid A deacylase LpxR family protein [Vibrio sp. KJ40-1]MDB1123582.1 lipid A deacylase LpxR family protein [Vibrio sp. KJ40-1]